LFGAIGLAAGQQAAAPHTRPAPPKVAATQPRLTDAQIDATIRMKLAKSKIAADKFKFHVQGGVVTIEGKTDVIQRKGAATRMARTAGAVAVVNQIQISDAGKAKAAANLESGRRRAQIKRGDTRSEPRTQTKGGSGGS
jgi:osmotically-inducible protein OsmY